MKIQTPNQTVVLRLAVLMVGNQRNLILTFKAYLVKNHNYFLRETKRSTFQNPINERFLCAETAKYKSIFLLFRYCYFFYSSRDTNITWY